MAGSGTEVARAYVTIIPKSDGVGKAVNDLGVQMGAGGTAAGEKASAGFAGAMGAGLAKAGKMLGAVGLAAGVASFGKESVQAGMQFDASMAQVAATMGTTVDQIGDLREFAQQMGATTKFSASESADALNYMALAGYDAETSMKMLPNVLNLAAAGNMDLARASDMVTDTQSALGLSLDETSQLVDKMARASSITNTSVAQLGDALLTVGGTAKNLSGGTTEAAQALGLLADNGIKGSEGGTALRNIILSLSSPTDKAATALKALGVEAFDSEGNMRPLNETFGDLNKALGNLTQEEQTQALSAIFNKVDLKSVNALLGTNAERWDEVATKIDGSWYSVDSLAESMSGAGLDMDAMKERLEGLGITSDEFEGALAASGGKVADFVSALQESADGGTAASAVAQALGGDLVSLQGAFDNTKGAAQAMADTQLDNLSGDVTTFQSALEGLQIKVSDAVTPALRGLVQVGTAGLGGLTEAMGWVNEKLSEFGAALTSTIDFEGFKAAFDAVGQAIASAFGETSTVNVTSFGELVGQAINGLIPIIQGAAPIIGGIASVVAAAFTFIAERVNTAVEFVRLYVMPLATEVFNVAAPVLGQIMSTVGSVLSFVGQTAASVFKAVFGDARANFPAMAETVRSALGTVASVVGPVLNTALSIAKTVFNAIRKAAEVAWPVISGVVETAAKVIGDAINGFGDLKKGVEDTFNAIKGFIEDPLGTAKRFVDDFATNIQNIIGGLDLSLPSIALPHFDIWGGEFPYGIGGMGAAPTFAVNWYGKGGFADGATLNGYGEKGLELYWPSYGKYFDLYAKGIAEHMPGGGGIDIHDNTWVVREEADIYRIARELDGLIARRQAGAFA